MAVIMPDNRGEAEKNFYYAIVVTKISSGKEYVHDLVAVKEHIDAARITRDFYNRNKDTMLGGKKVQLFKIIKNTCGEIIKRIEMPF